MSSIGGYTILDDFRFAGGGRCEWTFASKGGTQYFLKRFLSPKQPLTGAPGGPASIRARRQRCDLFERRQNRLLAALAGATATGGNLIAPLEFFCADGSYYKVTEKIDAKGLQATDVHTLPEMSQLTVLRSAANSLRILHSLNIVHGDVKTDNIILRPRPDGTVTASVIDFDDSYFYGEAPLPPEEFIFDPQFAAPEVFRFVASPSARTASTLTSAADVFSLGIVFAEYLGGRRPEASKAKSRYLGEAVLQGGAVELPPLGRWEPKRLLLARMFAASPTDRPTLKQVLSELRDVASPSDRLAPSPSAASGEVTKPRLVINMRLPSTAASPASRLISGLAGDKPVLRGSLAPKPRK
jgi:serine/threonine protein kinase